MDGSGVIQDDDLGKEGIGFSGWVSFGFRGNISSFDFFNRDIFDIETNIVSWDGFSELFVMHFNGFDSGGFVRGGEITIGIGF